VIQKSLNKRSQKVEVDADYVLRGIKSIAEGDETKDNDKLKAYELIGKHLKLFTDNINHTGNVGVTIKNDIPRRNRNQPN
jgi:phage terminase small subunit